MCARSAEELAQPPSALRGWRHIIIGQAVVTVLMLPMLRVHPGLTLAATGFNLLALANTGRLYRNRAAAAGQPPANPGRDLATVGAGIAGTALCAVALALWPR
ncbi:MAG TPA: hypothetical protein VGN48_00010 [Pedococcus sp.]|nr:hypothetical protein [Pedococcus sp.]